MAAVRYFVSDVGRAAAFYTQHLGFVLTQQAGSAIAAVSRGDLVLWLSGPDRSAAAPLSDGRRPEPGGWNRLILEVHDLTSSVAVLQNSGVRFRGDIVGGPGGRKALVEDPDGNPVELFEPSSTKA
jgi:catechol 2,3-dioxygenase-like lactoylglutathione lyase family enzyme